MGDDKNERSDGKNLTGKPTKDQSRAWQGWYNQHGAGCEHHGKQGVTLLFCHAQPDDPKPATIECEPCQHEGRTTILSQWDVDGPAALAYVAAGPQRT